MTVKTPITSILYLWTTAEQIDQWMAENLATATFEELTTRGDFQRSILHFAETAEQTLAILNAMEKAKGSPLTLKEVNPISKDHTTPLNWARTAEQTLAILNAMEQAKGDKLTFDEVNHADKQGRTTLHYANTAEQIKLLLKAMREAKASPLTFEEVNPIDKNCDTPLHHANTGEQILVLLNAMEKAKGSPLTLAEVTPIDKDGFTPLHASKAADKTKVLLEAMKKAKGSPLTLAEVNSAADRRYTTLYLANTTEQKLILRCEIALAKIYDKSATTQEIAAERSLNNLRNNDYKLVGLGLADLQAIGNITEFYTNHKKQIEEAVLKRMDHIDLRNFISAVHNFNPNFDVKNSPLVKSFKSLEIIRDEPFEASFVDKFAAKKEQENKSESHYKPKPPSSFTR